VIDNEASNNYDAPVEISEPIAAQDDNSNTYDAPAEPAVGSYAVVDETLPIPSSDELPTYGADTSFSIALTQSVVNDVPSEPVVDSYELPISNVASNDYSSPSSYSEPLPSPVIISQSAEAAYAVGDEEANTVAYTKPIVSGESYVQNDWKPINTYSNNPYNYPPPPPPPPAPRRPSYNPRPIKPSYKRRPAYNRHGRRPIKFAGSRKKPYPTIRPFPRTRWLNGFNFKNLFG